jgi:predicted adenine nucleotide alpha hydrolase (AANH) superfamily ATPase
MSKLLVHLCCAHCSAYTVVHWRRQGYDVRGVWYNPNIHPYTEHQQRLEAMKALAAKFELPLTVIDGYDMPEYFRRVAGHEADRCRHCFELRLSRTAATACELGCDAFTTTLLISPHQKHEIIREVGEQAAAASGVAFLYADLRKRYSDSRHITKSLDLYRQQYCGCIYSEFERYTETK